jgi:hypothetical protein
MEVFNLRLLAMMAPGLLLGTVAVSIASMVDAPGTRFVLVFLAVGSVAAMSWRIGAAALGGTLTRAHGLPTRLETIAAPDRKRTFDRETGLHAEWYFRIRVDEEIARGRRYNQPFTIVTFSTPQRQVMDLARATLREWLREVDFAGDLGHAVAICLPSTGRSGAWHVVERLTRMLRTLEVRVAEYPEDGPTLDALVGKEITRANGVRELAA